MNSLESAYAQGMAEIFQSYGINKTAAHKTAKIVTKLKKKASLFNFSDSNNNGFSITKLLLPLLAIAGTGFIAYNSGKYGDKNKSAFTNVKNYIGSTINRYTRNLKPKPAIDFKQSI